MGIGEIMAISVQPSKLPNDTAGSPTNLTLSSMNRGKRFHDNSTSLHPATKRRRLNQSTPECGSQTSASHWFENANHSVEYSMQRDTDFGREYARGIEWIQLTSFTGDLPSYMNQEIHDQKSTQTSIDPSFSVTQVRASRDDSENEDLRSVIDDLTIENKILRQMLSERRQHHDPELDHDKIFEVRTCGLSSEKKRELEAILQKFASSITDLSSGPAQTPGDMSALQVSPRVLPQGTTEQQAASYSRTDSAYASMSTSGFTSAGRSRRNRAEVQQMRGSKNKNIKSYLQDIPDSLLPKQSPIMSEKSRMQLVVKRLEQLFTGKNAAPGEHSQPLQQQKVSESAAHTDRHNPHLLSTNVRPEGAREAHILPFGPKMDGDPSDLSIWHRPASGSKSESEKSSEDRSTSCNRSPDQRPTRPLDLDIHRAQVANENIEYIRHLGLPTPTRQLDSESRNDGWVYLNLLINMAQLHTINVTPAFVRKSIAHLSTKLELSEDARKIRWNGAQNGTESSNVSENGAEVTTRSSPEPTPESKLAKDANSKLISGNLASTGNSNAEASRPLESMSSERNPLTDFTGSSNKPSNMTEKSRSGSAFDYKPLLLKDRAMLRYNILYDDSDNVTSGQGIDDCTGQDLSTQPNGIGGKYRRRPEEDGSIIYYRNPLFYCDMSGDNQAPQKNLTTVPLASTYILGVTTSDGGLDEARQEQSLAGAEDVLDCIVNDDKLPSVELTPLHDLVEDQSAIPELLASGVGGVLPDDHFMLQVQRTCQRTTRQKVHVVAQARINSSKPFIEEEIVSTTRVDLPASKLPPPSYVFFSLSSESSGDGGSDGSSSDDTDGSGFGLAEDVKQVRPVKLKRLSTYTSAEHCVTTGDDGEIDPDTSTNSCRSPNHMDLYTGASGTYQFDRAAILHRPLGILTGSLAATAGAGSKASVASDCTASSRDSSLEWETSQNSRSGMVECTSISCLGGDA